MHAGSVDEHDLGPVLAFILRNVNNALNAVARVLRVGRNDRQLFAHERIEQGGLARVRAAENANETGAEWHGWVLGLGCSVLGVRSWVLGPGLRSRRVFSAKA